MPLSFLSKQHLNSSLNFELIIVNNGSTDNLAQVSQNLWNILGAPYKLIIVDEPQLGLSNARKKGLAHVQYEYVMFCDDDNMPCDSFLINVYNLFQQNPQYACIGSVGFPEFEKTPEPDWFKFEKQNFAVGQILDDTIELISVSEVVGACASFNTFKLKNLFHKGFVFQNTGRMGNLLIGGEDLELSYALSLSGEQLAISSSLTFKHFLPSKRLSLSYLKNLYHSFGASFVSLDPYIDLINSKKSLSLPILIFKKIRLLIGYRDKYFDYWFNSDKCYDSRLLQLSFTLGYLKMILFNPYKRIKIRQALDMASWRR
jgi:glycosyltransferase involved in cell wall biosynthesis